jgi:D-xylose reductase
MAAPTLKLNSGYDMPQVGFGLWKVKNELAADVVYEAIKAGYRLFDGALDYGNEVEVGQGIARAIKEGIVKRSELFIVSKIWPTFHEPERVEPIARRQLADWGIDYFDLYLVHFPVCLQYVDPSVRYPPGWKVDEETGVRHSGATIHQTWAALEKLVDAGLVRSIGISNFQAQLIYDLLRTCRIRPATLQIEHHPYLTQPRLVKLAKAEGITITAYSSFGPSSFKEFKQAGHARAREMAPLMDEPTVKDIADRVGKKPSQVLLRWATQAGIAVIPKTNRTEMLAVNLDCTGWDIAQEDLDKISALNQNLRFNEPTNVSLCCRGGGWAWCCEPRLC